MKLRDRLDEWRAHWRGLCTHAGLRSCLPEPVEQAATTGVMGPAGELTPEMLQHAFDELWKGGPIRPDMLVSDYREYRLSWLAVFESPEVRAYWERISRH